MARVDGVDRLLRRLSWHRRHGPGEIRRAHLVEPIEKSQRGAAVFLVVHRDVGEDARVLAIEPALVIHDGLVARADFRPAREVEQRLEVLQRIARRPRPESLTENREEIDEDLAP